MRINEITLFDISTYDPTTAKIVVTDEIRRALASVLMSDNFNLIENTDRFIEWYNNTSLFTQSYNNINEN